MRNLLEYPVTYPEAINTLREFKESCDPNLIGDPRPTIIEWAITRLVEHQKLENYFLHLHSMREFPNE